ncbi:2,4-dichlorophenol 6-monooxygenase [Hibiscus syriacus]|uniref:2,4-dichlorophenol 6-monooxygenase n=1 Tax=Hibiscus syriacus TaxID=106335 RepID=A0A6A3CU86_HIBSY|nr:2,4-dichlorophenol 6-monooxygenase [Hibiscus syriacus]
MRSSEDKGYYEISSSNGFEFHRGNGANRGSHHRSGFCKPTPSKWDDAQKWLVGLSRVKVNFVQPHKNHMVCQWLPLLLERCHLNTKMKQNRCIVMNPLWRVNYKPANQNSTSVVRSVCVRDMGTEITPAVSQEPSRTATPIQAMSPSARSSITSGSSTPVRYHHGQPCAESHQPSATGEHETDGAARGNGSNGLHKQESRMQNNNSDQVSKQNTLESQAAAWDEAERTKYMARYKREEMKIETWENHEKRKAEMEMKKMEVKVERLKARAKANCANKLAATRRIAEEKGANAESKLNEKAMETSKRAYYMRRTGHLPSSFSFKLPSLYW